MLGVRGDVNMLFGTDWVETGKNKTFADLGMEGTVNMKVRKPQPLPSDPT
jgi:NaMN:DMB phosphoribosyltransferase